MSCVKISCKRICCRSQTKCCYAFNTFKGIRHYGPVLLRSSSNNGKSGKTLKVQVPDCLKDVIIAGTVLEDFFLELCAPPHPGDGAGWRLERELCSAPPPTVPNTLWHAPAAPDDSASPDVQGCLSPLCLCVCCFHHESSLLSSKAQLQHHLFCEAQAVNYSRLWSFFFF